MTQFKTKAEMVDFLRSDPSGTVDVDSFDKSSVKTLDHLFKECAQREVVLAISKGRVYRQAHTAKVLVFAMSRRFRLQESHRIYPGGKLVVKHNLASMSETLIRGETSQETAQRGLREECGLEVPMDLIRPKEIVFMNQIGVAQVGDAIHMSGTCEEYESTAYKGIMTLAHVHWFDVELPSIPWSEHPHVLTDVDPIDPSQHVQIFVDWVDELAGFEGHLRKIQRAPPE